MNKKTKYSEIRKLLNLESINGEAENIAFFTHYLQNNSLDSKYYLKAEKYFQKIIRAYNLDIDENIQALFPINWDIKFPSPKNPTFRFIDLFAGIGGFRIGAQNNNGKCVFSSEWDKFAQQTYEANFGEIPFGDITKIDAETIPDHEILFAGFPCQPFSYSGRNQGFKDKTRGTLFFDILRILETKKPKMFLLENVKGLKSHNQGKTLNTITKALENLGYNLHWEILKSNDYGLPQKRERWYCVGSIKNIDFKFPEKTDTDTTLRGIIDENENSEKLNITEFEKSRIEYHFNNVTQEKQRVEHDSSKYEPLTKKGRHGIFSYQKSDGSLRFHVGDPSKTQIQEAFYCTLETYSPTIIANRVPKLWDIGRKLSVLEAQRLQGYPDKYQFPVSDNQAYKQLGNSVSVPVIELIIKNMKPYL